MKSIYLLGDSHAGKLSTCLFDFFKDKYGINNEHEFSYEKKYKRVLDGKKELSEYNYINSSKTFIKSDIVNFEILSIPGRSALNFDYDFYQEINQYDSENSIIMPWFGYIDIKNWLPQINLNNYKDTKEVVDIYVENTMKKFKRSKIIFINPMPQFEVVVSANWKDFSKDPDIPFELRHEYHLSFTEELSNKCKLLGLDSPINISDILNVDWISIDMQFNRSLNQIYNDHLRPEFYKNILSEIYQKVLTE